MAGGARDIYSWSCLPSLVVGFFLYLVFFVCHISHQGCQFHHNKVENTHLDIHRLFFLKSTIDKPSHISYSSRAGPNIGSHTHYVRSELITSSPDRMFGVIELGLGEEWFGVSRSTTAADKATHKRS
ncbi:hypothetical protein D6D25_02683 [Aureobasidium pullulans]|nr:hypothetical protein D6D25_02683 [Aureobasidium pullulans]